MTLPSHFVQAFILTHWLTRGRFLVLSLAVGIVGTLPDVIPWIYYVLHDVPRWGYVYEYWHSFHWFTVFPPLLLHWGLDKLMHDPINGGWYCWAYILEVAVDILLVWYLVKFYFTNKKVA